MRKNSIVAIILVLIAISIGAYFLISARLDARYIPNYELEDFYQKPIKKVGVNEYVVTSVSKEDMAFSYFNIYTNMFYEDLSSAYQKLDPKEKEKYPSINSFERFVSSITDDFTSILKMEGYDIKNEDDMTVYEIKEENGHIFKFKIEGVMKYTVSIE